MNVGYRELTLTEWSSEARDHRKRVPVQRRSCKTFIEAAFFPDCSLFPLSYGGQSPLKSTLWINITDIGYRRLYVKSLLLSIQRPIMRQNDVYETDKTWFHNYKYFVEH